ncbi:phosphoribosylanthranilate isomerase [Geotalea sp. SG265]|uniref:phosphoribosylanthranilate isomerase n=1 Tax=Geotalea sp. SG265 TaxID=2922867 RepID=UPI001FAFCBD9|nr:phosphoribosylanthranilate isomerase [Geotalea sp. SG265]
MTKVKICGITTVADAMMAAENGADALGLVFYDKSPRNIQLAQAMEITRVLPPFVQVVGLFVNSSIDFVNSVADQCRLDLVQLHGDESPEFCAGVTRRVIKAFRIKDISSLDHLGAYNVAGYLLDAWSPTAFGGTGVTFNWDTAIIAGKFGPIILAGGLTPENVADAVRYAAPYGVDVSSGVEVAPGIKDLEKVRQFIRRAKGADSVQNFKFQVEVR